MSTLVGGAHMALKNKVEDTEDTEFSLMFIIEININ